MAIIEGDIDLTQNLDFYRKKPKKLLPANISLTGRKDLPKSRINTDIDNIIITSTSNTTIQIRYQNNSEWFNFPVNHNNDNESYNYLEIYDDTNDLYTTSSERNYNMISTSDSQITINSYISSNNTTYSFRYNDYISDNNWITVKNKINKTKSTIKSAIENKFKLWTGRPKLEEKESVHICCCYSCGKSFLSVFKSGICKDCLKEEEQLKSISKAIKFQGSNKFEFNHINYSQNYDYFNDIPWVERPKVTGWLQIRNHLKNLASGQREFRYGIPWFQKLNSRIYEDYIYELMNGEKDYSSYLTNMGWIGIQNQQNDLSDIDEFIDSIGVSEIEEVHSEEDIETRYIEIGNNSIQTLNYNDNIESISTWVNVSNDDDFLYYV